MFTSSIHSATSSLVAPSSDREIVGQQRLAFIRAKYRPTSALPIQFGECTSFQKALLLFDQEMISRHIYEKNVDSENKITSLLIAFLWLENRNAIPIDLFFEMRTDQRKILRFLKEANEQAKFEELWQVATDSQKGEFLYVEQDAALFSKQNPAVQRYALTLALKHSFLFLKFWKEAFTIVKESLSNNGNPWICEAAQHMSAEVISFLLNQNIDTQVLSSQNVFTPSMLIQLRKDIPSEIVERFKQLDGSFSRDLLECRLFGHAFEMQGSLFEKFNDPYKSELSERMFSILQRQSKIQRAVSLILSPDLIESLLFSGNVSQLMQRVKENKWSWIVCGWDKHRTALLFNQTHCVKIDSRAIPVNPGIIFYEMQNPNSLNEVITTLNKHLQDLVNEEIGIPYFHQEIDHLLELKCVARVLFQQISGNCAWQARKGALLAFTLLKFLREQGKPIDKKSISETIDDANEEISRHWEEAIQSQLTFSALPFIEKYPYLFDSKKIHRELIITCIKNLQMAPILTLLQRHPEYKNWKDPETGLTILQTLVQSHPGLFVLNTIFLSLHEMGCDASELTNILNQTFYEKFHYRSILRKFHSDVKQWGRLIRCLDDRNIRQTLRNYRDPNTGKSLSEYAHQTKNLYLLALLLNIGGQIDLRAPISYTRAEFTRLQKLIDHHQLPPQKRAVIDELLQTIRVETN